jgi:hypothetical protein
MDLVGRQASSLRPRQASVAVLKLDHKNSGANSRDARIVGRAVVTEYRKMKKVAP